MAKTMTQANTKPRKKSEIQQSNGRDEMNLAEFPFATLTRRDNRRAIAYEGRVVDKNGNHHRQEWVVTGNSILGLPTEFDERTFVALMAVTAMRGLENRKVPFSVYQILKIMGLTDSKRDYQNVEVSLKRLVGVTIYSDGAFWDNSEKERITTAKAFHLIEEYWLRYKETNEKVREEAGVPGYIIWGETIWNSFKANYIKNLDLAFFYSLRSPIARRLYRFLDKRMQYQDVYEIDILETSKRLGMARYRKPSDVKTKFQPAFDELIAKGFLKSAKVVKHKRYTRIRFVKAPKSLPQTTDETEEQSQDREDQETLQAKRLTDLRERYGITHELVDLWTEVLGEIELATTKATYQVYCSNTHLLSLNDNQAIIGVPNQMAQEQLMHRLSSIYQQAFERVIEHPVGLTFQVLERAQNVLEY